MKEKVKFMYFIGIDQHKRYSQIAVIDREGNLLEKRKIYHYDKQELFNYFCSFPANKTKVVLEATSCWYWLADLLEKAKLKTILAHPYKTRIIAESKIKTDSIDAYLLAQLNRVNLIPESFLAPKGTRLLREELRYRISLVKIRTSLKNKIHSMLEKEGIDTPKFSDLFGKRGLKWLKSLELDKPLSQVLKGYLSLIERINSLVGKIDNSIKAKTKDSYEAQLLKTIPGIGFFTAHLILCEVGDIERFPTAKKFSSYIGIVPSVHQSGGINFTGKITKQGNKYLRWALIEAAQKAIIKDGYLKVFYEKISFKKGKQKAKVAVANKLAHIIWAVLKYKEAYKPRIFKPQASPAMFSGPYYLRAR